LKNFSEILTESLSQDQWKSLCSVSTVASRYKNILEQKTASENDILRHQRIRGWCKAAFLTMVERRKPEAVCQLWSEFSNHLIQETFRKFHPELKNISILAMGKLGSWELNLSSDIDLIFISKDEPSIEETKAIRRFINDLSLVTPYAFAYRVDCDLRPGGGDGPIICSERAFETFFTRSGEPWNRLSFIRSRFIDENSPSNTILTPLIESIRYPRRLDERTILSLKEIRQKIQSSRTSKEIDIKYEPGGIRDIELLIQTLQVLHAGRNSQLKTPSMTKAIKEIKDLKLLESKDCNFLEEFYWKLRDIENILHATNDQQTYLLIQKNWNFSKFELNFSELLQMFDRSDKIVSSFFHQTSNIENLSSLNSQSKNQDKSSLQTIKILSQFIADQSIESQRIQNILTHFLEPSEGMDSSSVLEALRYFYDLLLKSKAHSSLGYVLESHPTLCSHLFWIFYFAPQQIRWLFRRPELLDSFFTRQSILGKSVEDHESLLKSCIDHNFISRLLATSHFVKNLDLKSLVSNLSQNAESIAMTCLDFFKQQFNISDLNILCLGKWGSQELGLFSDLDFLFICKNDPSENHFKVCRRLIRILQENTGFGPLFKVDLRIRPNESGGPLLVKESDLIDYLKRKAPDWQKQSFLRARKLGESEGFLFQQKFCPSTNEDYGVKYDNILKKLVINTDHQIDLKFNRGGLVHTEFTFQKLILDNHMIPAGPSIEDWFKQLSNKFDLSKIYANYIKIRTLHQALETVIGRETTTPQFDQPKDQLLSRSWSGVYSNEGIKNSLSEQAKLLELLD